jgi:hypothetical protein
MNEEELEERIRQLNDPHRDNIKQDTLEDKFFIEQPEYEDLKKAFRASKYHQNGWEWHQLVRIVLEPPDIRHYMYMYERLLNLILKHRRSYDDYFELKTEEGTYQIPNPIADLNRLEMLSREYFEIYHEVTSQIHFNYLNSEYSGPIIRGRINWHKTIHKSATEFPLTFATTLKEIDFITPENILLVLCAEWMYRESSRLLQLEFIEPLSDYNKNLIIVILEKTKVILMHFPFNEVLNTSKKFWALSYNDPHIKSLEQEARQRVKQGLVHNVNYRNLLLWIDKFRELNIPRISTNTPTRHILESIRNLDTVYEAWIFLEFVEYLYEKGILLNFYISDSDNRHCTFSYNGRIVTLWYEKKFKSGINVWAVDHTPDFTAMLDNEILAVFDAKNYTKSSSITDTKNKMLAYMTNLDTNFGALIYPYHPKYWDDSDVSHRREELCKFLWTKYPIKEDNEVRKIAKNLAKLSWVELPDEYRNILPPKHVKTFQNTISGKRARYHLNQTLCLLRMSPINSEQAVCMKKEALNSIFESIVSRIEA